MTENQSFENLIFQVNEIPQMKIFRFESSITYFNADYFRHRLLHTVGFDLKNAPKRTIHHLTHVIIDCSSINQFDYTGGKIFLQTIKELNDCQIDVHLCNLTCKKQRGNDRSTMHVF